VLEEYSFLTRAAEGIGHNELPVEVLRFYAIEFNHALKRALFCIVSSQNVTLECCSS